MRTSGHLVSYFFIFSTKPLVSLSMLYFWFKDILFKYFHIHMHGLRIRTDAHCYTMHNKFCNFLCFASFCAHLCAISNNFNCNDENRILGKWNRKFTDAIL